jgi:hypothetical protein
MTHVVRHTDFKIPVPQKKKRKKRKLPPLQKIYMSDEPRNNVPNAFVNTGSFRRWDSPYG